MHYALTESFISIFVEVLISGRVVNTKFESQKERKNPRNLKDRTKNNFKKL